MQNEYYNTDLGFTTYCMGFSNGSQGRGNILGKLEDIFSIDPVTIHVNDMIELTIRSFLIFTGDSASFYQGGNQFAQLSRRVRDAGIRALFQFIEGNQHLD